MPIIARFVLAADAALFQRLLREKGIPSTLLDDGPDSASAVGANNPAIGAAAIDVPDEHAARALAVHAGYSKDTRDTKARDNTPGRAYPNRSFPFFTIWMLIAVAFMVFYAAIALPRIQTDADADTWLFFLGTMFLTGVIGGLVIAFATAFLRMIPSVLKKKSQ